MSRWLTLLLFVSSAACGDDGATPADAAVADGSVDATVDATIVGQTYYLADDGDDSADGSEAAPFATFEHAVTVLSPGDTLVVEDGEYRNVDINCGNDEVESGLPDAPISLVARNERRARLRAAGGSNVLDVDNCSHYVLEGFDVAFDEGTLAGGGAEDLSRFHDNEHLTLRRILWHRPNVWSNSHMISLFDSSFVLIEENEFYDFHRVAITIHGGRGIVVRRNYINSRDTPNVVDGYQCCDLEKGDNGISVAASVDAVVENNIVERVNTAYSVHGQSLGSTLILPGAGDRARLLGNVAQHSTLAYLVRTDCEGGECEDRLAVDDAELVNNVSIDCSTALSDRGTVGTVVRNFSSIESRSSSHMSLSFDADSNGALMNTSIVLLNVLDVGGDVDDRPFNVSNYPNWLIASVNSTLPIDISSTTGELRDARTDDPGLGDCSGVYLPAGSPMRGAGVDGDIGASVLLRYENGVLTDEPLWDPTTGAFPCGAVVDGVNDAAQESCVNVHERLNVASATCPIP